MRASTRIATIAATILGVATFAFAQRGQGGPGMRQGGGMYDPATEATITGTIETVQPMAPPAGGPGGLHLMLRAEAGVIEVDLGPTTYITSKGFEFAKGDQVTVIGSKIKRDGQDAVIARQVTKGDKVLDLRNAQGIPMWSGRGAPQS
jgi:hypothetical protein